VAITSFMVVPNICGSKVTDLIYVTLIELVILR
jgi:hypothetical protein